MNELTHLSLFSGIGGLDLAAEWAGIKTVGQCEWAEYPTKVLNQHWPDVPRWKDIRTLTGESFYEQTGRRTVDIISGGFPCQPFSVAGKQRGKEDDRYLWPEMVRVIKELRPTWVVGETVAGIVRMALPDILSDLEACGYRTRTFLVPACAVGARHRRYRVAIVGCSDSNVADTKGKRNGLLSDEREKQGQKNTDIDGGCENVQYADSTGCQKQHVSGEPGKQGFRHRGCDEGNVSDTTSGREQWSVRNGEETWRPGSGNRRSAQPGVGGMADGLPGWVDGYWDIEPDIPRIAKGVANRTERIKALGNAVVPQQFYPIFRAIAAAEGKNEQIL